MGDRVFRHRTDAGRALAALLGEYAGRNDLVVLALPRGGVPVGFEVAAALGAPLDVFTVRKLGVPGRRELAMGAIARDGVVVLNDEVVRAMDIEPETIDRVAREEARELERREQSYRDGRPPPNLTNKVVVLVDDGLATGSSMRAAILAVRRLAAARIVVGVPAAAESTRRELAAEVDDVVCVTASSKFLAVGQHYCDFTQVSDVEVRRLLRAAPGIRWQA